MAVQASMLDLWFIYISAYMFCLGGIAKVALLLSGKQFLVKVDPILTLRVEHALILVAAIEINVAYLLIRIKSIGARLGLIMTLSALLLSYHLAVLLTDTNASCLFVGNMVDALGLRICSGEIGAIIATATGFGLSTLFLSVKTIQSGSLK